jgi:hypothetical protein
LAATTVVRHAVGLPMQITINQRQAECLHDVVKEG